MAPLSQNLVEALRKAFARRNERGIQTTDIFRLMVREKIRGLLKGREGIVVDIGCGEGYLLENILGDGSLKAALFDNSDSMLETAKKAYFPRLENSAFLIKGDARKLPFKDGSLDFAVCINTFYNLPTRADVSQSLRQIGVILRSGGSLFFDIRNRSNPFVKRAYLKVRDYDPSIGTLPLNPYTLPEIRGMLDTAGFDIEQAKGLVLPWIKFSPIILIEAVKR